VCACVSVAGVSVCELQALRDVCYKRAACRMRVACVCVLVCVRADLVVLSTLQIFRSARAEPAMQAVMKRECECECRKYPSYHHPSPYE
jgi:hypothetical protein